MGQPKIYTMRFATIYPLYLAKVERKGRTPDELHQVIQWLTGYEPDALRAFTDSPKTIQEFFETAPQPNPDRGLIKGVICGVRVEEIEDPLMRDIRYLDKLVDELAKGKKMSAILRS